MKKYLTWRHAISVLLGLINFGWAVFEVYRGFHGHPWGMIIVPLNIWGVWASVKTFKLATTIGVLRRQLKDLKDINSYLGALQANEEFMLGNFHD